jgi:hypothetical protein
MRNSFTSFDIKLIVTSTTIKTSLIHTSYNKEQFEFMTILITGFLKEIHFHYLHDSDSVNKA